MPDNTTMEYAWIVFNDSEVEEVLQHPDLHVRPPDERIPLAMQGTVLADIFERLVRMNEGERHSALRRSVDGIIGNWNVESLIAVAHNAMNEVDARDVAAYVVAVMIGLDKPAAAMPLIRDFAGAIAGGASDDAIARGVAAAPELLERLPPHGNADERANLLGFLFQTYAATGTMIENRLQAREAPPVTMTRRWADRDLELFGANIRRGDQLTILLSSPKFYFGAGRHGCPGRHIADIIVNAVTT